MLVPLPDEDLGEANAALSEPSREQAVGGEGSGLLDLGAIHLEGGLALAGDVCELRNRGLHAVGHLVLRDPGLDLRVADSGETLPIQTAKLVEHLSPHGVRHAGGI